MEIAVIQTGGKQYLVKKGDTIKIERLEVKKGNKVVFDKVLLTDDGKSVSLGMPYLKDVKVEATLSDHGREDKVIVFKYKPKTRSRKKYGHRQLFSKVTIDSIK
ncbi:MAG: 50S ribosomal protein L21 [Candidatus Paceibacterota bacterium]|jgi:large subunit ribosomal protein L21